MANLYLKGDAFWKQFKKPLNNISYDDMSHVTELFDKHIGNKINRIIDFGCGTGLSSHLLKQKYPYAEVVGVDISCAAISIASKAFNDVTWIHSDIKSLSIKADMLFSMGVRYSDLPWLVNLARKTCGGLAVFSVSSWTNDHNKREPTMNKLLLSLNNRHETTSLIFGCNPKYFESDEYKFTAIY